jgi:hypothetical protein
MRAAEVVRTTGDCLGAQIGRSRQRWLGLSDVKLPPPYPHVLMSHGDIRTISDVSWCRQLLNRRRPVPAGAPRCPHAGDSAGGGLSVTTVLAARDEGLTMPAAILTFSAGLDATYSAESMDSRAGIDPVFTRESLAPAVAMYSGGQDLHQALLSPVMYADLSGFPPMLLQVGANEVLLDDSTRMAARAIAAGVDAVLDVTASVPHVFQNFAGVLDEADQALDRAALFLTARLMLGPEGSPLGFNSETLPVSGHEESASDVTGNRRLQGGDHVRDDLPHVRIIVAGGEPAPVRRAKDGDPRVCGKADGGGIDPSLQQCVGERNRDGLVLDQFALHELRVRREHSVALALPRPGRESIPVIGGDGGRDHLEGHQRDVRLRDPRDERRFGSVSDRSRKEDFTLVREMTKEGTPRHTSPRGDLLHCRRLESLLGEKLQSGDLHALRAAWFPTRHS